MLNAVFLFVRSVLRQVYCSDGLFVTSTLTYSAFSLLVIFWDTRKSARSRRCHHKHIEYQLCQDLFYNAGCMMRGQRRPLLYTKTHSASVNPHISIYFLRSFLSWIIKWAHFKQKNEKKKVVKIISTPKRLPIKDPS